ncbi:MAG: hypothetical protein M0016_00245 [Deltaproteobacteria bacterium]|nr:hypothetical protein [Deltaproteobacteria bacterium]MCL5880942.1 hypothetical protein [Deltaproteobacteria bacterium]MDA8303590.1 hypothetical protein [Deltaproteobacteria bacterium]
MKEEILKSGFYDLQVQLLDYIEDFLLAVEYSRNPDFKFDKKARIKKVSEILKELKKDMKNGISIVDWQLKELGKEETGQEEPCKK